MNTRSTPVLAGETSRESTAGQELRRRVRWPFGSASLSWLPERGRLESRSPVGITAAVPGNRDEHVAVELELTRFGSALLSVER